MPISDKTKVELIKENEILRLKISEFYFFSNRVVEHAELISADKKVCDFCLAEFDSYEQEEITHNEDCPIIDLKSLIDGDIDPLKWKDSVLNLVTAASTIVGFFRFMEATREYDGDEPLDDNTIILQKMAGGASDMLFVKDFRNLSEAILRLQKINKGAEDEATNGDQGT
jgi:hypothetical protein